MANKSNVYGMTKMFVSIGAKSEYPKRYRGPRRNIRCAIFPINGAKIVYQRRNKDNMSHCSSLLLDMGKKNDYIENSNSSLSAQRYFLFYNKTNKEALEELFQFIKDNFEELFLDNRKESRESIISREKVRVQKLVEGYPKNGREHPYYDQHMQYLGLLNNLENENEVTV